MSFSTGSIEPGQVAEVGIGRGVAEKSIRGLQEAGLADPSPDPRYAAHALTGVVSRFACTWCAQGEEFELDKATDELTALWARAIGLTGRTDA